MRIFGIAILQGDIVDDLSNIIYVFIYLVYGSIVNKHTAMAQQHLLCALTFSKQVELRIAWIRGEGERQSLQAIKYVLFFFHLTENELLIFFRTPRVRRKFCAQSLPASFLKGDTVLSSSCACRCVYNCTHLESYPNTYKYQTLDGFLLCFVCCTRTKRHDG